MAEKPEYSNIVKAKENYLKTTLLEVIEVLKEGMKNSFKEAEEKFTKELEEIDKSLKNVKNTKEKKTSKEENVYGMKIEIEAINTN